MPRRLPVTTSARQPKNNTAATAATTAGEPVRRSIKRACRPPTDGPDAASWGNAFMALSTSAADTDLTSMRTKALLARLAAHDAAREAAALRLLQALRKAPPKRTPSDVQLIMQVVPHFGPPLSSFTGSMTRHIARHVMLLEADGGDVVCTAGDDCDRCFAVMGGSLGLVDSSDTRGTLLTAKRFPQESLYVAEAMETAHARTAARLLRAAEAAKAAREAEQPESGGAPNLEDNGFPSTAAQDAVDELTEHTFSATVVATEPSRVLWLSAMDIRRVMFPHEFVEVAAAAEVPLNERVAALLGPAVMHRLGRKLTDREAGLLMEAMSPLQYAIHGGSALVVVATCGGAGCKWLHVCCGV